MIDEQWVDVEPLVKVPTVRAGVADALVRQARASATGVPNDKLPANRAEARRLLRGKGPHMRFRYEVDDEGVRRGVRVRV